MADTNISVEHKNDMRPPIIVVMGHIDHGKTTLLDAIRKSNVAGGESGGITQHIGAYEVEHEGKKITFIDTPGHEAFGEMRSRGAKVADIAILVVAADDGVKPQTKEALQAIIASGIPYCVAINKIDKPTADSDRVKNDLAHEEVFLEGRGGNIPVVELSAKTGHGIDSLLETVLLMAELEDLKCDPKHFATGVVIEAHRDPKRGITATLLLRDGTLKKNEYVVAGSAIAKTRLMENYRGQSVESTSCSSPIALVGFDELPAVGVEFKAFFSQKDAVIYQSEQVAALRLRKTESTSAPTVFNEEAVEIVLVIKSDTEGSGEALRHEIGKLQHEGLRVKILKLESGDVTVDDIALVGGATRAIVIAFHVQLRDGVKEMAEKMNISVGKFDIIYDVSDFLKKTIEEMLPAQVIRTKTGKIKIIKIFKEDGRTQVVGGRAIEGAVRKGSRYEIARRGNKIGEGKFENLQHGKIAVSEVSEGNELGALTNSSVSLALEDILEIFEEETKKRTL